MMKNKLYKILVGSVVGVALSCGIACDVSTSSSYSQTARENYRVSSHLDKRIKQYEFDIVRGDCSRKVLNLVYSADVKATKLGSAIRVLELENSIMSDPPSPMPSIAQSGRRDTKTLNEIREGGMAFYGLIENLVKNTCVDGVDMSGARMNAERNIESAINRYKSTGNTQVFFSVESAIISEAQKIHDSECIEPLRIKQGEFEKLVNNTNHYLQRCRYEGSDKTNRNIPDVGNQTKRLQI